MCKILGSSKGISPKGSKKNPQISEGFAGPGPILSVNRLFDLEEFGDDDYAGYQVDRRVAQEWLVF